MDDIRNSIKYSRAAASPQFLREVLHCKWFSAANIYKGKTTQQLILASSKRGVQNSGHFIMRDKDKAPAYLVVQHWEFSCLCTAGEGAFGGVPRAQVKVRTDGWDVFRQTRRQKRMPRCKDCLSEHPRTDWLCLPSALLSLSGKQARKSFFKVISFSNIVHPVLKCLCWLDCRGQSRNGHCLPVGAGLLIDLLKLFEKQILDAPSRNKWSSVVDVPFMSVEWTSLKHCTQKLRAGTAETNGSSWKWE